MCTVHHMCHATRYQLTVYQIFGLTGCTVEFYPLLQIFHTIFIVWHCLRVTKVIFQTLMEHYSAWAVTL